MAEINLYASSLAKVKQRQKFKQLTWQSLLTILLILAVLLISLSVVSLVVARQNQSLSGKINTAKKEIEALRPIEAKQVYLSSKLDAFSGLLKAQEKHQAVAEAIFALLPDGTSLKGFEVSEEGLINLSGSVPDYLTLLDLLNRIKNSQNIDVPIQSAKVISISLNSGGGINFVIDVLLRVNS